jgi:acyl-CoA synthetase (AMP-forming)/AMP-acid ligase II
MTKGSRRLNAAEEVGPSIDLPSWLRAIARLDPDAGALHFEGAWRSWGWFDAAIDAFDELLAQQGLGEATKVGLLMRNRPDIVRSIMATLATRRCIVTLSSAVPATQLAAEIERLRLPLVVAGEADWNDTQLAAAVKEAGSLGVAANDRDPPFEIVVPRGDRGEQPSDTAPGVAVQMLTSGTTGAPKRIDLRYRSLEYEIASTAHYSKTGALAEPRLSSGTGLVWNPLLHIGGLRALITSLVAGRRVSLLERFSVDDWAAAVREFRPKAVSLVPAALAMVLDAELPKDVFEQVSAVFSGTAPLDPELARRFEERYGVPVLVVYGATEFAGGVAGWTLADWELFGESKRGSVGRANAGVKVRVVDTDSGVEQPSGQIGLLEVAAPQLSEPGWVRTTDLARMDDDGFIWIVGRADDVIVRGGFKVATNAVRDVIARHPAVAEACVIGVPDRRLGQVPVAAVELRPGAGPVSADDIIAWARERLTGYEVPVELQILDELPRTPSMKVSQAALRPLFRQDESI